jgi:phosphatidylglycerophosphatase A
MDLKKLLSIIGQGFGSGLSPVAPGTVGSFVAASIYYFLIWDSISSWSGIGLFLLFIVVSFYIGIFVCSQISGDDEDPKSFVWDEFVGMWISCFPLLFIDKEIYLLFLAFFIFRFFDIYKPLGIKSFDGKSGAFYVMIDDVIAGIYSACLISLIILITTNLFS